MDSGRLDIYNVSGTLIRSYRLRPNMLGAATFDSPNSLFWDGCDSAGDRVANGTYIYLLRFERNGKTTEVTGKAVHLK